MINICNNFQKSLSKRPAVMKVMHEEVENVMGSKLDSEHKFVKHRPFYVVLRGIFADAFEKEELVSEKGEDFLVIAFMALVREFAFVKYFFPERGYRTEELLDFFLNSLKKG